MRGARLMSMDNRRPPRRAHRRERIASHRHESQAWRVIQALDQGLPLSRYQHLIQPLLSKVPY
jgi:hypothetical protein